MIKPKSLPVDTNRRANRIARLLTGEETSEEETKRSPISEYLAEIGRKGGKIGGAARASKLSPKRRSEIARKASRSRWNKAREYPHDGS